jgi:hypothetical protein
MVHGLPDQLVSFGLVSPHALSRNPIEIVGMPQQRFHMTGVGFPWTDPATGFVQPNITCAAATRNHPLYLLRLPGNLLLCQDNNGNVLPPNMPVPLPEFILGLYDVQQAVANILASSLL